MHCCGRDKFDVNFVMHKERKGTREERGKGVGVRREKRPLWRGEDHKMGSRTSEAVGGCFKAMIVGQ